MHSLMILSNGFDEQYTVFKDFYLLFFSTQSLVVISKHLQYIFQKFFFQYWIFICFCTHFPTSITLFSNIFFSVSTNFWFYFYIFHSEFGCYGRFNWRDSPRSIRWMFGQHQEISSGERESQVQLARMHFICLTFQYDLSTFTVL